MKIEPVCQLQCPHDCTVVLPLLSNERALKSGTFGVPGLVLLGRGITRHKFGTGGNRKWLACWTQAQKGLGPLGSNRSRDAVG